VAVNVLTPTATVGGEVVKGMLVRRWMPLSEGFASVMIDKLTFALGQATSLPPAPPRCSPDVVRSRRAAAGVTVLGCGSSPCSVFALQKAGIFRVGLGVMRTISAARAWPTACRENGGVRHPGERVSWHAAARARHLDLASRRRAVRARTQY